MPWYVLSSVNSKHTLHRGKINSTITNLLFVSCITSQFMKCLHFGPQDVVNTPSGVKGYFNFGMY